MPARQGHGLLLCISSALMARPSWVLTRIIIVVLVFLGQKSQSKQLDWPETCTAFREDCRVSVFGVIKVRNWGRFSSTDHSGAKKQCLFSATRFLADFSFMEFRLDL